MKNEQRAVCVNGYIFSVLYKKSNVFVTGVIVCNAEKSARCSALFKVVFSFFKYKRSAAVFLKLHNGFCNCCGYIFKITFIMRYKNNFFFQIHLHCAPLAILIKKRTEAHFGSPVPEICKNFNRHQSVKPDAVYSLMPELFYKNKNE